MVDFLNSDLTSFLSVHRTSVVEIRAENILFISRFSPLKHTFALKIVKGSASSICGLNLKLHYLWCVALIHVRSFDHNGRLGDRSQSKTIRLSLPSWTLNQQSLYQYRFWLCSPFTSNSTTITISPPPDRTGNKQVLWTWYNIYWRNIIMVHMTTFYYGDWASTPQISSLKK